MLFLEGLPPPRPPGPGASGANKGVGRPAQTGGAAAFGRRPPILGTPVGAGGARSGGSGGREPPRKASPPELCYLAVLVAGCYRRCLMFKEPKCLWAKPLFDSNGLSWDEAPEV